MKKFASVLAITILSTTACFANADKAAKVEPVEMIDVPTELAATGYNYLLKFPAGEVKPLLDQMESLIKQAVDGKKEKISLPKASMDSLYKALMNDNVVKLTIGLQQILQPTPTSAPQAEPNPVPEKK